MEEQEQVAEPEVQEEQQGDEQEQGESQQPDEGPDYAKQIQGLESGLSAERKKYKEELGAYRRELDYLRGAIEGRGQQQQVQQPRPIVKDDDEFWEDIPGALNRAADVGFQRAAQFYGSREMARVNAQAMEFMEEHPDYLEAEQAYLQSAQMRPGMIQDLHQTANPAQYVYKWWQKNKQGGDVADLQAKIAELEAKLGGLAPGEKPKPPKTQAGGREASGGTVVGSRDPWANRPL